jgi:hypothetical protein
VQGSSYIYARDCPTTRSVGPLVIGEIELDEAGHTVLIALDSRREQDEVRVAVEEGWQQPPLGDRRVSRVHEVNDRERGIAEATFNQGEPS